MFDFLIPLHESLAGGAWPFLVGEVICQVHSENERDSSRVKGIG